MPVSPGAAINTFLLVDNDCATSQPQAHRAAVGTAEHTSRVSASAALLVNRMLAVRTLGQLDAELQGLGTEESWLTS